MKATLKIKDQVIDIDLTVEQVATINKANITYTDIKSLEDALAYNGESIEEFNHRTQFDNDQQRAGKELEVINQALRMGNPLGEYWYYPVFNSKRSASGFSFRDYSYSVARIRTSAPASVLRILTRQNIRAKHSFQPGTDTLMVNS